MPRHRSLLTLSVLALAWGHGAGAQTPPAWATTEAMMAAQADLATTLVTDHSLLNLGYAWVTLHFSATLDPEAGSFSYALTGAPPGVQLQVGAVGTFDVDTSTYQVTQTLATTTSGLIRTGFLWQGSELLVNGTAWRPGFLPRLIDGRVEFFLDPHGGGTSSYVGWQELDFQRQIRISGTDVLRPVGGYVWNNTALVPAGPGGPWSFQAIGEGDVGAGQFTLRIGAVPEPRTAGLWLLGLVVVSLAGSSSRRARR